MRTGGLVWRATAPSCGIGPCSTPLAFDVRLGPEAVIPRAKRQWPEWGRLQYLAAYGKGLTQRIETKLSG